MSVLTASVCIFVSYGVYFTGNTVALLFSRFKLLLTLNIFTLQYPLFKPSVELFPLMFFGFI
jgi:hypothetical protein